MARHPLFPDGSPQHGYVLAAPLDDRQRLDEAAWRRDPEGCRVRRFWAGLPDRSGRLVHRIADGGDPAWVIDYDTKTDQDDEIGYRLEDHLFTPGEYVTINDALGPHSFRVISVEPQPSLAKSAAP